MRAKRRRKQSDPWTQWLNHVLKWSYAKRRKKSWF